MKVSRRLAITTGATSIASLAMLQDSKAQDTKNLKEGAPIKASRSVAKRSPKAAALATTIHCELINDSSSAITSAEYGLQDSSGSGDPVVRTVEFGRVPAGTTATKNTTMPTGVEVFIYKLYVADDPEPYTGIGFGNNATEISLTFTD